MFVSEHSEGGKRAPPTAVLTAGQLLREARKRAGLSQEKLSEVIGISQSQISKAERDEPGSELRHPMIVAWAGACDTSPQLLMPKTAPPRAKHNHHGEAHPREMKPGPLHAAVKASLESYVERKGHMLSDVQRQRLPVLARGVDPNDEEMPMVGRVRRYDLSALPEQEGQLASSRSGVAQTLCSRK